MKGQTTRMRNKNIIIFTDLDGTFLDHDTYSYRESEEALRVIQSEEIPLIFCSAKTRAEQEVYQRELKITHPFIVENGGAIFIKNNYFSFPYSYHKIYDTYHIIELGIPYQEVRRFLLQIRTETHIPLRGYGDMQASEVASITGLSLEAAERAMKREYTEPVLLDFPGRDSAQFKETVLLKGLNWTFGGRFYSVMGPNDKGKAVKILTELYKKSLGSVSTLGIGDSLNDAPLLSAVDIPILVQKPGGTWENMDIPNLYRATGVGPIGWNNVFKDLDWIKKALLSQEAELPFIHGS